MCEEDTRQERGCPMARRSSGAPNVCPVQAIDSRTKGVMQLSTTFDLPGFNAMVWPWDSVRLVEVWRSACSEAEQQEAEAERERVEHRNRAMAASRGRL